MHILTEIRTFIKWEHVSVLLASLSLSLYNAAGKDNNIARALSVAYTLVAVFAGAWGWWMYIVRSRMIEQRSGKDLDNVIGPVVVCIGLVVALCLNFGFKVGGDSGWMRSIANTVQYRAVFHNTDAPSALLVNQVL
jgi:hypothetical protein